MQDKINDYCMMNDNVYFLYKIIHRFSNIVFLAPAIELTDTKNFKEPTFLSRLLFNIYRLVFCGLTCLAFTNIYNVHPGGDSSLLVNMEGASLLLNFTLIIIILRTSRQYKQTIPKMLFKLNDFDDTTNIYFAEQIDTKNKCRKHIIKYLLHMAISNIFLISEIIQGVYIYDYVQWYTINNYLSLLVRQVMVFQYITILNFVYWRLLQLNNLMNRLETYKYSNITQNIRGVITISLNNEITQTKLSDWNELTLTKIKDTMYMLRFLHECLTNVCNDLSDFYDIFHAIAIVTTLVELLTHMYGIFILLTGAEGLTTLQLMLHIARLILYMYIITITHHYFVFYFCDIVNRESTKSGHIIHQFFLKTHFKNRVIEDVRLFSLQLQQNKLLFSAAGVFTLSWELMSEIVGEVGSYLIFFIQSSGFTFNSILLDSIQLHPNETLISTNP